MKEEEDKKESGFISPENSKKKIIIFSILIFIITISIFYIIFNVIAPHKRCDSWECFNENLEKCRKTKFAGGGKEILFGYTIQGGKDNYCQITVEYLQGDISIKDSKEFLGKKMICKTPKGIIMLPESDLSRCSGELKEKLQEQIISRLHTYIIQNIGEINKLVLNPEDIVK
jgi:flagellar basal body-associated protein FliL